MSRRGRNEGSLYKRADGTWAATVELGFVDGKRKRRYLYARTKQEVARKLTEAARLRGLGVTLPTDRLTVSMFLATWLKDVVQPSVRRRTHESYSFIVRRYVDPTAGGMALAKLAPQHVQALLTATQALGLSPRTVQYVHTVLRMALNQALKWNLVGRNVATLVTPPRVERAAVNPLDPDEARLFLASVRGTRLEALYTVALSLGLRQGEALALRWPDVDLDAGTLTVRATLQRVDGKLIAVEPKTRKSRRTIVMPAVTVAALRAHRVRQAKERLAAGAAWSEGEYVFCGPMGLPLDGTAVTKRFQRELDKAGLRRQRFHDLRHACASLLLAQGVAPRVVMETLGHTQISTTMDIYSHVIPALERDAADRMNDLLTAGTAT